MDHFDNGTFGCLACDCSSPGSQSTTCDVQTGNCTCLEGYVGATSSGRQVCNAGMCGSTKCLFKNTVHLNCIMCLLPWIYHNMKPA